jgi:hypothetical protein
MKPVPKMVGPSIIGSRRYSELLIHTKKRLKIELTCRFYERSDSINFLLGDNVAEGHSFTYNESANASKY